MHFCSDFAYKECPVAVCYIRIVDSFQSKFLKDKFELSLPGLMWTSFKIIGYQLMFCIFKLFLSKTFNIVH